MQTDDVAGIAAGLTKAQRDALLADHWSCRQGKGLIKRRLCYIGQGPHGRQMVKFRPLGIAVRNHIKEPT